MLDIIGYFAAILMGVTLGSIGGGGSILTVPILVYLMGVNPVTATGYSLLLVGSTAAFGAFRYYRMGQVNIKASIIFAIPSIIAVYSTRAFLMPAIPDIINIKFFSISKDLVIMVLFAILMVLSATMMLRDSKKEKNTKLKKKSYNVGFIILEGALVGIVTGILGAGGGFLIIPALVLLVGMPMKEAIGSSLLIISLKSLLGFLGDVQNGIELQFPMLPMFFLATLIGMFLATKLAHKLKGDNLQKIFAYFTLVVATIILFREFL